MRVANSVDRALRRLLRDDERAELSVRLKALAPDEMESADVLAELRRTERLSMSTAAAIHELLEIRRRLKNGEPMDTGDPERAIGAVDRLTPEISATPQPIPVESHSHLPLDEPELPELLDSPRRRIRQAGVPALAGLAAAAIVVIALGMWVVSGREPSQLDQGVALFQSGEYAEAANHFWRFAEENPDDATPHLYLARIHRRMDRPDLAAEALREAQRLAPEDPAVHRELAFLLLDTGRSDVAVGRFRTAIEMEPESSEGWVGLVRALRESGQDEEAAQVIQEAPAEVRALLE
ncbi:MAG: tetratricopeptide repeat protein [Gemmatimonas sp.]|nr:tetratricopeptide repeat protein [Gemmatimonas sp.]